MWTPVGPGNHVLDGNADRNGSILRAKGGRPRHVRWSVYSNRLSRGQHRYGVDSDWGVLDRGAHWHNPANTTEPYVCIGDAALCQITLTTCYTLSFIESWRRRHGVCRPTTQRWIRRQIGLIEYILLDNVFHLCNSVISVSSSVNTMWTTNERC